MKNKRKIIQGAGPAYWERGLFVFPENEKIVIVNASVDKMEKGGLYGWWLGYLFYCDTFSVFTGPKTGAPYHQALGRTLTCSSKLVAS